MPPEREADPSSQMSYDQYQTLQQNPSDQRGLPTARAALEQPARLHLAVAGAAADRAFEAIRPAPPHHQLAPLRLRAVEILEGRLAEPFLKLHRVTCHRCPSKPHDVHDMYHTRGSRGSRVIRKADHAVEEIGLAGRGVGRSAF